MTDSEKKVLHVSHFCKFYDTPPLPSFPDIRYVLLSTIQIVMNDKPIRKKLVNLRSA